MFTKHWTLIGGVTAALLAVAYVFWPSKSRQRKGFPGLHNFGNSCFLNVILQSWASCPSLLRWLNLRCTVQHEAAGSVTAAVLKALKVLNNASEEEAHIDVYNPGPVLLAMERRGWVISPGQQDCHELMHALSETLDEETSRYPSVLSLLDVKALQDSKNKYQSRTSAQTRSLGLLPVLPGRQDSPLHGLLASQAVCLSCGHHCPVKYDLFDSLTLTLPQIPCWGGVSVESLLHQYVHPEIIENAHCPGCAKQHGDGAHIKPAIQRRLSIGKLPQCLCLHIQRLQMTHVGLPVKRQDHITFPEFLSMDAYLYTKSGYNFSKYGLRGGKIGTSLSMYRNSASVNLLRALNFDASSGRSGLFLQPPSSLNIPDPLSDVNHNSPTSPTDFNDPAFLASQVKGNHFYRLTSVVSHLGDVLSGHFVTYRRGSFKATENELLMSDTWWYASDCTVERTSLAQVMTCQAYMLFYERM